MGDSHSVLALICIFLMMSNVEYLFMYLLAIHKSSLEDYVQILCPFLNQSLRSHLSFRQQQSCQSVGLPSVKRSQFLLQGPPSRVLILGAVCLFAAGRTKPHPQHSCSTGHLFINNWQGYFPCASDGASVNFLSLQVDHVLHPLCLVHPGAQEISH